MGVDGAAMITARGPQEITFNQDSDTPDQFVTHPEGKCFEFASPGLAAGFSDIILHL